MRAFGRDLIRGGHYGQRSCEPHLKAEHMAAPTNAAYVKKALANSEPSTHGTKRTSQDVRLESAKWGKADLDQVAVTNRNFMNTRPNARLSAPAAPGGGGVRARRDHRAAARHRWAVARSRCAC